VAETAAYRKIQDEAAGYFKKYSIKGFQKNMAEAESALACPSTFAKTE
jgi:hypothetical protein